MESENHKQKAIKILTQNGFTLDGDKVTYYESISVEKSIKVRNLLSDIVFINESGNEATYQLVVGETPEKLELAEIEI